MAESFRLFATANPREPGIAVDVQMQELKSPSLIPVLGTLVSDVDVAIKRRIPTDWQGYGFVEVVAGPQNMATFKFAKLKSATERLIAFEEATDYMDFPWPDVVYSIQFTRDDRFPRVTRRSESDTESTVYAPRWYTRKVWKKGLTYNSKITVRKFLSDHTPFSEVDMEHVQPVPGMIEWDFNGAEGSMYALHGDIWIKSHGNTYVTFAGGITSADTAPQADMRHFEPTVFEDWAPFILSDKQARVDGIWVREQIEIEPPPVGLILEE